MTKEISTHTLRGERDIEWLKTSFNSKISTHTLRGERDAMVKENEYFILEFQLTRSVGSVTRHFHKEWKAMRISTHTLRGERDTTIIFVRR